MTAPEHPIATFVAPHLDTDDLRRVTFTGTVKGAYQPLVRAVIRPVEVQDRRLLQVVTYDDQHSTTTNVPGPEAPEIQALLQSPFRHVTVLLTNQVLEGRVTKKGRLLTSRTPVDERLVDLAHDRRKQQPIAEDTPFLDTLGIAVDGRVKPSRQAKYRQINDFIRLLDDANSLHPRLREPLHIVDLGCGNAYLTFAIYHHLTHNRELDCTVTGVDRNVELIDRNNQRAQSLGWTNLRFEPGDLASFEPDPTPGIVVALHACDTASDHALAAAVRWDTDLALVAPCCHHHLQTQLRPAKVAGADALMLRDGILRERLGDVLTDTTRAALLRVLGYSVDVVQFVDPEHTPRNTLIRAAKRDLPTGPTLIADYQRLTSRWAVTPFLAELLLDQLDARGLIAHR